MNYLPRYNCRHVHGNQRIFYGRSTSYSLMTRPLFRQGKVWVRDYPYRDSLLFVPDMICMHAGILHSGHIKAITVEYCSCMASSV